MLNIDLGAGELIAQRLEVLYNAEIDGGIGELNITFKEKLDEKEVI